MWGQKEKQAREDVVQLVRFFFSRQEPNVLDLAPPLNGIEMFPLLPSQLTLNAKCNGPG